MYLQAAVKRWDQTFRTMGTAAQRTSRMQSKVEADRRKGLCTTVPSSRLARFDFGPDQDAAKYEKEAQARVVDCSARGFSILTQHLDAEKRVSDRQDAKRYSVLGACKHDLVHIGRLTFNLSSVGREVRKLHFSRCGQSRPQSWHWTRDAGLAQAQSTLRVVLTQCCP
jgi:hypothetical protein